MSNNRTISPFEGKPFTRTFKSKTDGEGYRIIIRELTPARSQFAEFTSVILGLFFCYAVMHIMIASRDYAFQSFAMYSILFFIYWWVLHTSLLMLIKKVTVIKITAKNLSVSGFLGSKNYDRSLQHKFLMLRHDKAPQEKQSQALTVQKAGQRGKIVSPKAIYGESFHIVFEYMGQRNDLAVIYGRKDAQAVLARLKACDNAITARTQIGSDGTATSPNDQWGDQTGEIPVE